MLMGSFAGTKDGPCLFLEKEKGIINSATCCEKIVSLVDGMIWLQPWFSVMQDNAPSHSSKATAAEFRERQTTPVQRPSYLPDLNSIENVWECLKDFILFYHSTLYGKREMRRDEPRKIVKAAWDDTIRPKKLERLIKSMPRICEAVIRANGSSTKY